MRLIDADALIKKAHHEAKGMEKSYEDFGVLVEWLVDKIPTIEPERKKGKWILTKGSNGKDYHKCSECLHTQEITGVKNYCAVCGADMMEGHDENDKT